MTSTQQYENKELEEFIEGQWIKIGDGDTRVLEFKSEKTQVIEKKDFNGNLAKKVQFIVIDLKSGNKTEKKFEVSRRQSIDGIDEARKELWRIYSNGKLTVKEKLLALKTIIQSNETKFKLLAEGPSVLAVKSLEERLNEIESAGQISQ